MQKKRGKDNKKRMCETKGKAGKKNRKEGTRKYMEIMWRKRVWRNGVKISIKKKSRGMKRSRKMKEQNK